MRKSLFFSGVCLLLLASCARDPMEFTPPVPEGTYEVKLFNEIQQITKTRINDEGFCDGDAVGVYVVNYENGNPGTLALSGNQADNVKYTLEEATNTWKPSTAVYYYDRVTHVDIYGYYPYGSPSSISEYPFEVQRDQSKEAANGNMATYEASDFLWAKTPDVTPVASAVPLQFNHKMAGVMVTLVEGTGFSEGEFAAASKAVLVTNTVRTAKIDLSTGVVTPYGDVPATGIVPIEYQGDFRAVVVPQTVAAGTPLFTITVEGLPYVFRKDEAMQYTSGRLHKFTVSVSKKSESGLEFNFLGEAITPWENDNVSHDATAREYVVIHCPEAGKLKETIVAQGKDYTKIKNLKVTGTITDSDYYFMRDEMTLLQSVNLKEVASQCLVGCRFGDYFEFSSQKAIPGSAFFYKTTLVRCVFPDDIDMIGDYAFSGTSLTGSIIIPSKVRAIGCDVFLGCPINGTLMLSDALEAIGRNAFAGCSNMRGEISFPHIKYIGDSTFSGTHCISSVDAFPESLVYIGQHAFNNSGISGSLILPSGLHTIYSNTFANCGSLNGELVLPKNVITIQSFAFSGCGFRYPLNLPESLVSIGDEAFNGCSFTGQINLPKNLSVLGRNAFAYNRRMTGTLDIPESLSSIPSGAFNTTGIEEIVIPRTIEYIGDSAFGNSFNIISITSFAQTPPVLGVAVFSGVGKDNLTVEVPETSVNEYITAAGWNEFKRFSAHREFSVSRNLFRTLNAETSKELLIRAPAGESWSVESKPDWVTVSPDSGTGYAEITLNTTALARGAGNREGEVVFLLDGKDYRVRTKVEQYDYQYGDGDVLTHQTHTIGDGVNLVFMGDCFDAKDISEGKYTDAITEAIGYFFDIEPYNTYKDYFNVYSVIGMSPDSGVGDANTIREARFGTQYTFNAGLSPDTATIFEVACLAPINDDVAHSLIVMIENSEQYAGLTYMYGDGSAISLCPVSRDLYPYDFRGLIQHEAGGHGFGKLADEYIYHNVFVTACPLCGDYLLGSDYYSDKSRGWYENIHHNGKLRDVPWYHLMMDPEYMGTVDIYEGAYLHARGVFRSEPSSCMNNNIPYFNAISREAIVKRIMDYAGEEYTFEKFKQHDVKIATMTKSATDNPLKWTDKFEPGHQREPVMMGDKPVFNKPKR